MNRVQQGLAATIQVELYRTGTLEDPDPDSATITITRSDGTALVTDAATDDNGTGVFGYTLSPTQTALLDTLTAYWTVTFDGVAQTVQTTVEVVGGFVFTLAQARATSGLDRKNNDQTYVVSTARIIEMRTEVERRLEQELGFAMVPRYTTETVDGPGGRSFLLANPYVRALRSVTVNGTALGDTATATISRSVAGSLYYPVGWPSGNQNIGVGYEHGLDVPPPGARDVALALARRWLVSAPADDRAQTMTTNEQTTTFYLPGADEPFDVPAANRFVTSNTMRTGLA